MTTTISAYAANSATEPLTRTTIERREVGPHDVAFDIKFAGICHSDIHTVKAEWGLPNYPVVPGHEIAGIVTEVGSEVTRYKVGDRVGVGCFVDSCRECDNCRAGLQQYCTGSGMIGTYDATGRDGTPTYGGYSTAIVVDENYVLRIPDSIPLDKAAPLLCAGITLYSPLRHWNAGPGKKVAVIGLGGLGHMGVKLAHAMGAHVVLFTTSPNKREDGLRLGADRVVVSKNPDEMAKVANSLDFILNTVAAPHDLDAFLNLLKRDGTMTLVGAPDSPHPSPSVFNLIFKRRSLAGSLIGGIQETQDMLDFCARHGIVSEIEMIDIQGINESYERMLKGDVKYRFVIDMDSLKREIQAA